MKSKLVELSREIKAAKAKEARKFDLVDVFQIGDDMDANGEESSESNVLYAPKSKKLRTNEEETRRLIFSLPLLIFFMDLTNKKA